SRIGKRFLFPGVGFGGSCFPKDVEALIRTAQDYDFDLQILNSVMTVNHKQKTILFEKLMKYYDHDLEGRTIGIWGLSFKPNTDDIREAPAVYIIEKLLEAGAQIRAHDPEAMPNIGRRFGDRVHLAKDQYEVLENADALLIVTEWSVFRTPDFKRMKNLMNHLAIFDGRNVYEGETMEKEGFYYESIGRRIGITK